MRLDTIYTLCKFTANYHNYQIIWVYKSEKKIGTKVFGLKFEFRFQIWNHWCKICSQNLWHFQRMFSDFKTKFAFDINVQLQIGHVNEIQRIARALVYTRQKTPTNFKISSEFSAPLQGVTRCWMVCLMLSNQQATLIDSDISNILIMKRIWPFRSLSLSVGALCTWT